MAKGPFGLGFGEQHLFIWYIILDIALLRFFIVIVVWICHKEQKLLQYIRMHK